jgi:antitoxin VapB
MGAQLNIKDAETIRLARELAEMTGQPITKAIRTALERELAELDRAREERLGKLRSIVKEARTLWKPEFDGEELSITHADHLYDERGLPK